MSKTLIFSPSSNIWGGGQIYIEQLCNFLNENKKETYIITFEPETFSCKALKMGDVSSKKNRIIESFKIAKKYKKEGFKNIILNDLASMWLAPIFRVFGFNVISLLHLYLERLSQNPLGHSFLEYQTIKFGSYFCNDVFSVNKNNIEVFGKRVKFIGNYVPNWFFEAKFQNQKEYDFILIARLAKQKNIPLFLRLLKNLNEHSKKEYKALIVGEGEEKTTVLNTIRSLNLEANVTLQNWCKREELPNVFDKGKVFVISSTHEGFATTLLEAHARGIPSISTYSAGFCSEYIEGYENKTGLSFSEGSINDIDFLNSLIKLLNEYESYKEICIKKAKIFSQENVLTPILKAIKDEN